MMSSNVHLWFPPIQEIIMNSEKQALIKASIKSIPDYPKPGILFRDVTSLMEDAAAYKATIEAMVEKYKDMALPRLLVLRLVVSCLARH